MAFQKIPLMPLPNQTMRAELEVDGEKKSFYLEFNYRDIPGYWTLTIRDNLQNDILSNVPVVTGGGLLEMGNLFSQFGYKKIGSAIIFPMTKTDLDIPDKFTLGTDFQFFWGDTNVLEMRF